MLGAFDLCLAQDADIAARFESLGARGVTAVGSLKADAPPLDADETALAALKAEIGSRPVLLAAQTHEGEDETILPAHDALSLDFPGLLTIIVPRHTARGQAIAMLCGPRPSARRAMQQPVDRCQNVEGLSQPLVVLAFGTQPAAQRESERSIAVRGRAPRQPSEVMGMASEAMKQHESGVGRLSRLRLEEITA